MPLIKDAATWELDDQNDSFSDEISKQLEQKSNFEMLFVILLVSKMIREESHGIRTNKTP